MLWLIVFDLNFWLILFTFILLLIVIFCLSIIMINDPPQENEITEFVKIIEKPEFKVRIFNHKKFKSFITDIILIGLIIIFIFQLPKLLSVMG